MMSVPTIFSPPSIIRAVWPTRYTLWQDLVAGEKRLDRHKKEPGAVHAPRASSGCCLSLQALLIWGVSGCRGRPEWPTRSMLITKSLRSVSATPEKRDPAGLLSDACVSQGMGNAFPPSRVISGIGRSILRYGRRTWRGGPLQNAKVSAAANRMPNPRTAIATGS